MEKEKEMKQGKEKGEKNLILMDMIPAMMAILNLTGSILGSASFSEKGEIKEEERKELIIVGKRQEKLSKTILQHNLGNMENPKGKISLADQQKQRQRPEE